MYTLYDEYKRTRSRNELLKILSEAENDVKNGRIAPIKDTFDDIRNILKKDHI